MKRFIVLLCVCLFLFCGCDEIDVQSEETKKICTVTFDSLGGSDIEPQVVAFGEKATEPAVPIKKCNCEFDGWYLADEKWSFVGYVITENITLTAKWIECFGLNDKEIEVLKRRILLYDSEYDWQDLEGVKRNDPYVSYTGIVFENNYGYEVTFKDGVTRTYVVGKNDVS